MSFLDEENDVSSMDLADLFDGFSLDDSSSDACDDSSSGSADDFNSESGDESGVDSGISSRDARVSNREEQHASKEKNVEEHESGKATQQPSFDDVLLMMRQELEAIRLASEEEERKRKYEEGYDDIDR